MLWLLKALQRASHSRCHPGLILLILSLANILLDLRPLLILYINIKAIFEVGKGVAWNLLKNTFLEVIDNK